MFVRLFVIVNLNYKNTYVIQLSQILKIFKKINFETMSVYFVFNYLLLNLHSKIIFQFFARGKQYMLQPLAHPTTPKVWIHFYLAEQKAWPAFDLPVPMNDIKMWSDMKGWG